MEDIGIVSMKFEQANKMRWIWVPCDGLCHDRGLVRGLIYKLIERFIGPDKCIYQDVCKCFVSYNPPYNRNCVGGEHIRIE